MGETVASKRGSDTARILTLKRTPQDVGLPAMQAVMWAAWQD